jgi:site-specific DNA-cytosine methylase
MYTKFLLENLKGLSRGRPGDRWEINVEDLKEISWRVSTGFIVAQDRKKWQALMNMSEYLDSIKGKDSLD